MNARNNPGNFEFRTVGSLFTLPVPFTPVLFGQTNHGPCSGLENMGQCDNFGDCSASTNEDTCQNMGDCDQTVNKNDCGNVFTCENSSNLDGCGNSVCYGSQNNGDGDWFLFEGCTNSFGCGQASGGPYPLTTPGGKLEYA